MSIIVLGALSGIVLGVAPTEGVGPASGPVFPILGGGDGDGDDEVGVQLRMSLNDSDVRVGESVAVRVETAEGTPVEGAVVRVGDRRLRTDRRGTVVLSFSAVERYEVRASKPEANGTRYGATARTVEVDRRTVALSVRANRTAPSAGDPVGVRVTLPDGSPANATLRAGDARVTTGPDGRAVVRFHEAGSYDVTVEKAPNATARFAADPLSLSVGRRAVDLRVAVPSGSLAGETVTLGVTRADTGEPLNATVTVGDVRRTTGPDGTVTLRFDRAGEYAVTARAAPTPSVRFRPDDATLRVRRRTVGLSLSTPDRVEYGEAVTFELRRTGNDARVAGAVRVAGAAVPTDRNGTLTVVFLPPGPVAGTSALPVDELAAGEVVRVVPGSVDPGESTGERRPTGTFAGGDAPLFAVALDPGLATVTGLKAPGPAERFRPAEGEVLVVGPAFAVADVDAGGPVHPGGTVALNVTVENRGNDPGSTPVVARVAGRSAGEWVSLDLAGRTTATLALPAPDETGVYDVVVTVDGDRVRESVTVRANESDGALVDPRGIRALPTG